MSDWSNVRSFVAMYPTEYLVQYGRRMGFDLQYEDELINALTQRLIDSGYRVGLIKDGNQGLLPSVISPGSGTVKQLTRL